MYHGISRTLRQKKHCFLPIHKSILVLCLILFCTGCSDKAPAADTDIVIPFTHVAATLADTSHLYFYTDKSRDYNDFMFSLYGISAKQITGMVYCFSDGASADEVVIVKTKEARDVKALLQEHLEQRIGDFTGYVPTEVEKLKNAVFIEKGDILGMIVSDNPAEGKTAFLESMKPGFSLSKSGQALKRTIENLALSGKTEIVSNNEDEEIVPESGGDKKDTSKPEKEIKDAAEPEIIAEVPGVIEPYDTSQIIKAYKTRDASILTDPHDIQVLEACQDIISSRIKPDMSDYEKELQIHDYLIDWGAYDDTSLSSHGYYQKYSDQPYGLLINQQSICLGYASSFHLLMNMLDIECIIVTGSANGDRENHAWNMVKLEDGWYNVDVTWDDSASAPHAYFNVDDAAMTNTNHYWRKDAYPKSSGIKYHFQ